MKSDLTGSQLRRAENLDALDAILPLDRRDQFAEILTDDDVESYSSRGGTLRV